MYSSCMRLTAARVQNVITCTLQREICIHECMRINDKEKELWASNYFIVKTEI